MRKVSPGTPEDLTIKDTPSCRSIICVCTGFRTEPQVLTDESECEKGSRRSNRPYDESRSSKGAGLLCLRARVLRHLHRMRGTSDGKPSPARQHSLVTPSGKGKSSLETLPLLQSGRTPDSGNPRCAGPAPPPAGRTPGPGHL